MTRLTDDLEAEIRATLAKPYMGQWSIRCAALLAEVDALRAERDQAERATRLAVKAFHASEDALAAAVARAEQAEARIAAVEDVMHRADTGEFTDDEFDAGIPLLCEAARRALGVTE